jgi:hypothetical protein
VPDVGILSALLSGERSDGETRNDPGRAQVYASWPEGKEVRVILAASTIAIVAIAAVIIVAILALVYLLPRGGRRRR